MKEIKILLIEDDEIDAINVKKSLEKCNIINSFTHCSDGVDAVELLTTKELSSLVVLLDLNMPKMNGHEFLDWLREKSPLRYRNIPVVVLTTSDDHTDIEKAYKSAVSGYILKPVKPSDFVETMAKIGNYWLMCEVPT